MQLKEFIETFICSNSLIRLWYPIKGGHKMVVEGDKSVCMEWKIIKGEGIFGKFTENEVIGVTDIHTFGPYPEAINIVIKEIPLDLARDKKLKELGI